MYRNKRISSSTQSKTTSKLEEYWLPRKATRSKSRFYIKEANSIQRKLPSKFRKNEYYFNENRPPFKYKMAPK